MQRGSRHCRQDVAIRKFSKRRPSRTSRVTPSCASAQALTQASQRVHFCKSRTRRLCASIGPGKILVDGYAVNHLESLGVCGAAFLDDILQARANGRELLYHLTKIVARNAHYLNMIKRSAGSRASAAAEQSDFAEIVAT